MPKSVPLRFLIALCSGTSSALLVLQVTSCGSGDDSSTMLPGDASPDSTTMEGGGQQPDGMTPDGSAPDATTADSGDGATPEEASPDALAEAEAGDSAPEAMGCSVAVPSMGAYIADLGTVACTHIRDCCGLAPSRFDMATCTSAFSVANGGWLNTGDFAPLLDGGRLTYDTNQACQCIVGTGGFNCGNVAAADFIGLQDSCFAALTGTVAEAGSCASSYECAPGLYCAPNGDAGGGACSALVQDGGACAKVYPSAESTDFACSYRANPHPPLYCDPKTKTCISRAATGAGCASNTACQSNRCLFANGAATCSAGPLSTSPAACAFFTLQDAGGD